MVADFPEDLTTQACDKIISCLNTESILGYGNMFKPSDDYLEVLVGGETLLNIRGWGYLTGNGSLRLPSDKAIDVQKSLCMFICEQLNSKKLCQTPSS